MSNKEDELTKGDVISGIIFIVLLIFISPMVLGGAWLVGGIAIITWRAILGI